MKWIVDLIRGLTYKQWIFTTLIGICFIASMVFVNHNSSFYKRTIAEVTDTQLENKENVKDQHGNEDQIGTQQLTAVIQNGERKGDTVHLTNKYSISGAYDQHYQAGNELFISVDNRSAEGKLSGSVLDVKRDKYVVLVGWFFILMLLVVGKRRGLFSLISLTINAGLMFYALDVYVNHGNWSLLWISGILVILFTVISLLLLNGFNEMTYAAIASTLIGIFLSLLITYVVIKFTAGSGLRYEEMQFLTRPYKVVFMAGLFVGSLGAVMDVAITISSSIFGLYESNPTISVKALHQSGMDIGKDVMGTLTNILFFVYASGSIPSIILFLKNSSALGFTLSMNLSLEFTRALAGGIGIVLTIPIAVYTSIFFVKRKRNSI
ncbi:MULTISPECIES: YibE/F family protein [Pontibacillus]|uniref:YibE/F family protein n=1 Tax=Pontibacillus chungwhensis TaxID=265426 RepID=A0ABY8UU16_9BACI|nr:MULTISPECIES: YibE/F family protein [Pontibacillus]MCD5323307.1 YibE/F family protein [Pontibacillus sp. HN14]WIF96688.1 YibE/F family protein [Pontibacillus chungwhensis]